MACIIIITLCVIAILVSYTGLFIFRAVPFAYFNIFP